MTKLDISNRKIDHIRICSAKNVESERPTGFEDIYLIHRSLPEINMDEVDTSCCFMGHRLLMPLVIEAMTGGAPPTTRINQRLARAAEALKVAMGVGSQRIALENPAFEDSFRVVRKSAPDAFLIANIGAPQLAMGYGVEEARRAVEMIEANALAIHVNAAQECVQPEGEPTARGVMSKIEEIAKNLHVPVIVKETGAGISGEEAAKLEALGVSAIDVGGVGGTDWAKVESYRKPARRTTSGIRIFHGWGIPTAASLIEVTQSTKMTTIASGGIRNGLQIAKSIALGASAAGLARPLLAAALRSHNAVARAISAIQWELKVTMFLTGSRTIADLQSVPLVITGDMYHWLTQRGFDTMRYAKRR
jgi:isopentenyl-diphosphate delta-isomerase